MLSQGILFSQVFIKCAAYYYLGSNCLNNEGDITEATKLFRKSLSCFEQGSIEFIEGTVHSTF